MYNTDNVFSPAPNSDATIATRQSQEGVQVSSVTANAKQLQMYHMGQAQNLHVVARLADQRNGLSSDFLPYWKATGTCYCTTTALCPGTGHHEESPQRPSGINGVACESSNNHSKPVPEKKIALTEGWSQWM